MKNVLPDIYYVLEGYITFAEKFVTIVVTVTCFDYINPIVDYMAGSVAALPERV